MSNVITNTCHGESAEVIMVSMEMQVVDDLNKQQHKFEFREWNQQ